MTVTIHIGDCREVLRSLPDESVHCVVTSPPYWRQRDYGHPGQLGLEQTPEEYVNLLVEIMREARRVLRSDGTCWVNIGDKWASGGNVGGGSFMDERREAWAHVKGNKGWRTPPAGYKDKDLVGVPWMVAFAMRADGWYLRQCNIWAKPNGMPESVTDRSTVSHEYVFHFSKSKDYWYDNEAARTPAQPSSETRLTGYPRRNLISHGRHADTPLPPGENRKDLPASQRKLGNLPDKQRGHTRGHAGFNERWDTMERDDQVAAGANFRSVWWIAPAQYREGHYAVMPDALAEICILAGCPVGGTILDPFGGAGTTGLVADRHHRNAILIELNSEYAALAERRITAESPLFAQISAREQHDGTA